MRHIHKDAIVSDKVNIIGNGSLYIDAYSVIEPNVLIDLGESGEIHIGYRSKLKYGCVVRNYDGKIVIGDRTTIGEYSILAGHGGIAIGDAVIISGQCYLSAADHIFTGDDYIRFQGESVKGIRVNDGAWIGARCVVLDGVIIDRGCVIGAGSVVTKNMGRNKVCYGNPCREAYNRNSTSEEKS